MTHDTKPDGANDRPLVVEAHKGEAMPDTMARVMIGPYLRHGIVGDGIGRAMCGKLPGEPNHGDYAQAIKNQTKKTSAGELTLATELLTAQALSLDAMFTELARRATMNLGEYPMAAERYARLAFKAQSNSRATLEALAKLHQPREQTVRHVHVNEGGQAIVTENFHHHSGEAKNDRQPHATIPIGERATLPSPDPCRHGVPVASDQGAASMQDARRQGKRRT